MSMCLGVNASVSIILEQIFEFMSIKVGAYYLGKLSFRKFQLKSFKNRLFIYKKLVIGSVLQRIPVRLALYWVSLKRLCPSILHSVP